VYKLVTKGAILLMKVMKLSKQFAKNHTFSVELDSQSTNESVRSAGSSPTLIHKEIVKKEENK